MYLVFNTVNVRFISNLEHITWLIRKLKVLAVIVNYINGIYSRVFKEGIVGFS